MPRIDQEITAQENKFKKRRAWNFLESLNDNNLETFSKQNENDLETIINTQSKKPKENVLKSIIKRNENKIEKIIKPNSNETETNTQLLEKLKKSLQEQQIKISSYDIDDIKRQILSLVGVQEVIFFQCYMLCIKNNSNYTGPVNTKNFFEQINITVEVGRTSLGRLKEKGLINRTQGKRGQNGFCLVSLPEEVMKACGDLFHNVLKTI